jgi:HK97 family phage portal protein
MSTFTDFFKSKPKAIIGDEKQEIKKAIAAFNLPNFSFKIDDGKQISSLIICSRILAADIGRLPLKLYKTDSTKNKEILKDDPRHLILHNHPNSYLDSYSFWSAVEFARSSEGNAYVKITRDSTGYPTSLDIIDNDMIGGIAVANGELFYEYKSNPSTIINSKDILHFRNLSINGLKGRDPKDDLNLNLAISFKALTTLDNFYNNGAIGTLTLETVIPEGVDATEWSKQSDEFGEKYAGYLNSNKLLVTPPFTKLNPISINFADAELVDTIKYNNGQVACYYGVPPHKVGIIENSKFNSLQELQNDYVTNTIAPIITMYRRELELKLLSDAEILDGYSIEFESGALLITDSKTRIANYKDLFGMGAITRKRIAQLENIEFEGDSDYFIATGFMGIDKATGKIPPVVPPVKPSIITKDASGA